MGDTTEFEPLTKADKVSVVVYRGGIVVSSLIVAATAYVLLVASDGGVAEVPGWLALVLLLGVYVSVGLSVFFIHLYMGNLKTTLKRVYYLALACLVALLVIGQTDLPGAFASRPYLALLLVPVSLCLGFITAKEAYCFKLLEGYALFGMMPGYLALVATGFFGVRLVAYGAIILAATLIVFTLRKIFMPLHYDIGDKTAYA